jgi:hypothetical protein
MTAVCSGCHVAASKSRTGFSFALTRTRRLFKEKTESSAIKSVVATIAKIQKMTRASVAKKSLDIISPANGK